MQLAYVVVLVLALLLAAAATVLTAVAFRGRRQFTRLPGVFRCRLRSVRGMLPGVASQWRGRPVWAAWAHDVLLVRLGHLPPTTRVFRVRFPEGSVTSVPPAGVKGLGPEPVTVRLRLDDGDLLEVAAPVDARDLLAGPFLVACVTDEPAGG